jgi:hypothetical protein
MVLRSILVTPKAVLLTSLPRTTTLLTGDYTE